MEDYFVQSIEECHSEMIPNVGKKHCIHIALHEYALKFRHFHTRLFCKPLDCASATLKRLLQEHSCMEIIDFTICFICHCIKHVFDDSQNLLITAFCVNSLPCRLRPWMI